MTTTAGQNTTTTGDTPAAADLDVVDALRRMAGKVGSKRELYREALPILGRHFEARFAVLGVDSHSGHFEETFRQGDAFDEKWKSVCDALLLDTRYRNIAVAKQQKSAGLDATFLVMAAPIAESQSSATGSMVFVAEAAEQQLVIRQVAELKALLGLLGMLAAAAAQPKSQNATLGQAEAALADSSGSVDEYAFTLANGLKTRLGCDQVCLGLVRGGKVKLACISGLDELYPRSPGVRLVRQAMEECLDAGRPICFQSDLASWGGERAGGDLLHRRWHHETGNSAVASLPLQVNGRCVAILSLRKRSTGKFSPAALGKVREVVSGLMPRLTLLEQAGRSLKQHAWDSARETARRWLGPSAWRRRLVLAGVLLAAAWLTFGTTGFVVTVPCQVVADNVRQISAPFEGVLASCTVRPGDAVHAGQVLVEFDVRDLRLERDRLKAQRRIAELELIRALAEKDHDTAAQAAARVEIVQASLDLTEHQIDRSRITAPADGSVLSGDLSSRLGEVVEVGEPLLQFAPADDWTLELRVPQHAASYLKAGQQGRFTTTALPDRSHACQLRRVPVSASVIDGRHTFLAECSLAKRPEWTLSGMTGVARIEAGDHPIWWVVTHRIVNAFRLYLWKL